MSGNTKYRLYSCTLYRVPVHCTVPVPAIDSSTVLHGARMYTVVNTGTVQNSIQVPVQVLGNTLKLGVR